LSTTKTQEKADLGKGLLGSLAKKCSHQEVCGSTVAEREKISKSNINEKLFA